MTAVVKAHSCVKGLIEEWRNANPELAIPLWEEFERRIREANGPPPESRIDRSTNPPTYWCDLTGQTEVQLVVKDRRVGFFGSEREVIVINLVERPPV